jgi:hypothetical protein
MVSKFLRPSQAADFLRENFGFGAVRSLAKMRVVGGGPNYHAAGRLILYTEAELLAWAKSRLTGPHRSTSEIHKAPTPQEMEPLAQPQLTRPSPVARRPRGRPRKPVEDSLAEPAA